MAVRNSLLERFSGKFRRCWKVIPRFSGSTKCYPCQGLGTFGQGKRLLENWPRLLERCWIFSSETATAFLSSSEFGPLRHTKNIENHRFSLGTSLLVTGVSRALRARNAEKVSKMSRGASGQGIPKRSPKSRGQPGESPESLRKVSGECFGTFSKTFSGSQAGRRPRETFSRLFRHFGPGRPEMPRKGRAGSQCFQ